MILSASWCIRSNHFLDSLVHVSHPESLYSSRGRINAMYNICSSACLFGFNLRALIRLRLVHAVSVILFICSAHVHDLEKVRPRCLCFTKYNIVHFERWMCNWIEFLGYQKRCSFCWIKSTKHEVVHVFIVSKSILRLCAADCGVSTIIFKLVPAAKRPMDYFILQTISFLCIKKSSGPKIEPWGTPARIEAQSDTKSSIATLCLQPKR